MAVGHMLPGAVPRVEIYQGQVLAWAGEADEQTGFLLDSDSATGLAARLLGMAASIAGDDLPMLQVDSVDAEAVSLHGGEPGIRLIFMIGDAPLSVWLDLTKFAEITASFAVASRMLDRSPD